MDRDFIFLPFGQEINSRFNVTEVKSANSQEAIISLGHTISSFRLQGITVGFTLDLLFQY